MRKDIYRIDSMDLSIGYIFSNLKNFGLACVNRELEFEEVEQKIEYYDNDSDYFKRSGGFFRIVKEVSETRNKDRIYIEYKKNDKSEIVKKLVKEKDAIMEYLDSINCKLVMKVTSSKKIKYLNHFDSLEDKRGLNFDLFTDVSTITYYKGNQIEHNVLSLALSDVTPVSEDKELNIKSQESAKDVFENFYLAMASYDVERTITNEYAFLCDCEENKKYRR